MSEYINGREKWTGAKPDERGQYYVCDECGTNEIRMTSHFDGPNIYGYDYQCKNGHHIRRTIKRNPSEAWDDELTDRPKGQTGKTFSNFPERNYNYSDLEHRLLAQQG